MSNRLKIPFHGKGALLEFGAAMFVAVLVLFQLWSLSFGSFSVMGAYGNFGDESVMSQASVRILGGQVPHRDFYSYAPGTTYLPMIAWMFLFGQDHISVQSFNFFCALILTASLVWLGAFFSRRIGMFCGLLFAFVIFPLWPFASYHWQFLICAILSTRLLMGRMSDFRVVMSGSFLALAALSLPNKGAFLAFALLTVIALFSPHGKRLKRAFLFLSGPLCIGVFLGVVLTLSGLVEPVWRELIYNNLTFYPTLSGGSVGYGISFVLFAAAFFAPLYDPRLIRSEWRDSYLILATVNTGLMFSVLYFSEPIHMAQVSAVMLVLLVVALADFWRANSDPIGKHVLKSVSPFIMCGILIIGYWWLCLLIVLQLAALDSRPVEQRMQIATLRGSADLGYRWHFSINRTAFFPFTRDFSPPNDSLARQLPVMDEILRTRLAGQRVFFFPFAPGYYYFYKKDNPTSYDLFPSSSPPRADEEKLKQELSSNTDALVYIKNGWLGFKEESELMRWMRENFPQTTELLGGEIVVMSKK